MPENGPFFPFWRLLPSSPKGVFLGLEPSVHGRDSNPLIKGRGLGQGFFTSDKAHPETRSTEIWSLLPYSSVLYAYE